MPGAYRELYAVTKITFRPFFPRKVRNDHLPSLMGSCPLLITLVAHLWHRIVIVPPGWYEVKNGSINHDV